MDCNGCTLCCKLLQTHEVSSEIGEYCRYCDPGRGCTIHADRPKECRDYQCMWSQMENAGAELRPDHSHIIFDRIADDVITSRLEDDKKLSQLVMNQIKGFNQEGFSVLVFRGGDRKFFLNGTHTEEDVLEVVRDRCELH